MYANDDNDDVTYFDSFGAEYIPKEIRNLIGNRHIITNNFKTLTCHIFDIALVSSIICDKSCSKDEGIFKEEQSIKMLTIPGSIKIWKSIKQINYF